MIGEDRDPDYKFSVTLSELRKHGDLHGQREYMLKRAEANTKMGRGEFTVEAVQRSDFYHGYDIGPWMDIRVWFKDGRANDKRA